MIQKLPRYLRRQLLKFEADLKWHYTKNSHESAYFYTFAKCASTLFSGYVLKNIQGLRHIDYAQRIYSGKPVQT